MRRSSSAVTALLATLLVIASSCTATESVTVLESANPANAAVAAVAQVEPTASAVAEPTSQADNSADDSIEVAPADADDDPTVGAVDAGADNSDDNDDNDDSASSPQSAGSGCTYLGVDDFDDMQVELRLTSDLDVQADVSVGYTVWDGARTVLVESTHWIEDLAPGESVRMSVDTVTGPPANADEVSCTVGAITSLDGQGDDPFRSAPGDSCRFVEIDFANDVQIEVMLANPLDEAAELAVDFAVRSSNGIRFSDGVAYSEQLDPGELTTLPIDTFDELPPWVSIDEVECAILAIEGY